MTEEATSGRMLIVKVKRTDATTADLFAPRRKFPDLKLFELAMLGIVGVNFEDLQVGVETPCLFYANWQQSEKTNQHGNFYKDIVALEPFDGLDSKASDTAAQIQVAADSLRSMAATMRLMAQLMAALLAQHGVEAPELEEPEPEPPPAKSVPVYGDGTTLENANDAERSAFKLYVQVHEGDVPENVDALRTWFAAHQNGKGDAR